MDKVALAELPLKIRTSIRDIWDNPSSELQRTIGTLQDQLGVDVTVRAEWPMLWSEFKPVYPDMGPFVPGVAGVVKRWCELFYARLQDDQHSAWADEVLEKLSKARGLKAYLQTCDGPRSHTTWVGKSSAFCIELPKSNPICMTTALVPLENDLAHLFAPATKPPSGSGESEWMDVVPDRSGIPSARKVESEPAPDFLPGIDTLPRPEVLFETTTPHLLVLRASRTTMHVQGSHQPSLELLSAYLEKWIRQNRNNVNGPPMLKVVMEESMFGLGGLFDGISVQPTAAMYGNVNPIIVRSFIEGVLKYKVEDISDGVWHYRRDDLFQ
ncbi:MAG: hypothetical protein M1838_002333 [Thelocarpon superellum]|nr:MAG: hypothetical protein M1838_002333 [Thelocarpon superellum]